MKLEQEFFSAKLREDYLLTLWISLWPTVMEKHNFPWISEKDEFKMCNMQHAMCNKEMRNKVTKNYFLKFYSIYSQISPDNRSETTESFLFDFHSDQTSRTHFKSETFELVPYFLYRISQRLFNYKHSWYIGN